MVLSDMGLTIGASCGEFAAHMFGCGIEGLLTSSWAAVLSPRGPNRFAVGVGLNGAADAFGAVVLDTVLVTFSASALLSAAALWNLLVPVLLTTFSDPEASRSHSLL